ncbi:MAG: PGPGW domain-containing protein [Acidobacteriota bacterium]|nr:PGPGW domain-containing protein [Acidobacteriota bacterium]
MTRTPDEPQGESNAPAPRKPLHTDRLRARLKRTDLSLTTRILLFVVGWSLVLIGVAGLALPGIQGILTILVGAAVLSVASETVYRLLRTLLRRWPWAWDKIERFQHRVHDRLSRK